MPTPRLGEFIAWIIGWDLILEYAFGATTVAIGWSGYVVSFLKDLGIVDARRDFATAPFAYDAATGVWPATGAIINLPGDADHRRRVGAAGRRHQ